MEEKIKELMSDREFVKRVASLSAEEAQKVFAENGVEISVDELNGAAKIINQKLSGNELSADNLDAVSGGKIHWGWYAVGVAAGAAVALMW